MLNYCAGSGQHLSREAESRLRLKIDFYIVPIVSLLYLFCFIDRANLGEQPLSTNLPPPPPC